MKYFVLDITSQDEVRPSSITNLDE